MGRVGSVGRGGEIQCNRRAERRCARSRCPIGAIGKGVRSSRSRRHVGKRSVRIESQSAVCARSRGRSRKLNSVNVYVISNDAPTRVGDRQPNPGRVSVVVGIDGDRGIRGGQLGGAGVVHVQEG